MSGKEVKIERGVEYKRERERERERERVGWRVDEVEEEKKGNERGKEWDRGREERELCIVDGGVKLKYFEQKTVVFSNIP